MVSGSWGIPVGEPNLDNPPLSLSSQAIPGHVELTIKANHQHGFLRTSFMVGQPWWLGCRAAMVAGVSGR